MFPLALLQNWCVCVCIWVILVCYLHFADSSLLQGLEFNPSLECVFWDSRKSRWSREGVKTKYNTEKQQVTCKTNHLTNFAILMVSILILHKHSVFVRIKHCFFFSKIDAEKHKSLSEFRKHSAHWTSCHDTADHNICRWNHLHDMPLTNSHRPLQV